MKIIYMPQTINLIAQDNNELAQELIRSGVIVDFESGKYLKIE